MENLIFLRIPSIFLLLNDIHSSLCSKPLHNGKRLVHFYYRHFGLPQKMFFITVMYGETQI